MADGNESKTHEKAEKELQEAAEKLNKALGGKKVISESADYFLHLGLLTAYDTREDFKIKPEVNLRLVLPGFRRRLRLLFNSSERRSFGRGFESWKNSSKNKNDSIGVGTRGLGLEFRVFRTKQVEFVAQEFLKLHHDRWPDPVSRLLLKATHAFKHLDLYWRLGPHWDPRRGFGSLFEPSVEVYLAKDRILRAYSGLQWWDPDHFFKRESLSLIGALSKESALYTDISYEYRIGPYQARDLSYSVGYRSKTFFPWLIGQLTPTLILDGRNNWKPVYRVALGFEVSFGSRYSSPTDFLTF